MSETEDQGYVNATGYWYPMSDAPADYADLRKLAGDVAEMEEYGYYTGRGSHCLFCEGAPSDEEVWDDVPHRPDCLWLRAQRWKKR